MGDDANWETELMVNTLDWYCCVCQWWHDRNTEYDHEPLITLPVFQEILTSGTDAPPWRVQS